MESIVSNKEKYDQAFIESFSVTPDVLEELAYQSIPEWDSVGHMGLIAALEDTFDIMMETEDIIEFGSYVIGIEMMKKYDIEL
jgi:acyl carrier protein